MVTDEIATRAAEIATDLEPTMRNLRLWPSKPDAVAASRDDLALLLEPWVQRRWIVNL